MSDVTIYQTAILVKSKCYLDALEAVAVAYQRFGNRIATLVILTQLILQMQAGLYSLTATSAAYINPIIFTLRFAATAKQRLQRIEETHFFLRKK
jgi:hypothetical protein